MKYSLKPEDLKKIKYINWHAHSSASLIDGMNSASEIVEHTKNIGHCGCGLSDHGSMANSLKLLEAGKKHNQKVGIGIEFYIVDTLSIDFPIGAYTAIDIVLAQSFTSEEFKELELDQEIYNSNELVIATKNEVFVDGYKFNSRKYYHITVYAKNEVGYRNLCYLRSISSVKSDGHFYYRPRITFQELFDNKDGLIVFSGCFASVISQLLHSDRDLEAEQRFLEFKKQFGEDFYTEIHLANLNKRWDGAEGEHVDIGYNLHEKVNIKLLGLAKKYNVKAFFVQDSHMTQEKYWKAQTIMMTNDKKNSGGKKGKWHFHEPLFIHSVEEMYQRVQKIADYIDGDDHFIELCENSIDVINKIDYSALKFKPLIPNIKYTEHPVWNQNYAEIEKYKSNKDVAFLLEKAQDDQALNLCLKIITDRKRFVFNEDNAKRLREEIEIIQYNGTLELLNYFLLIEDVARFVESIGSIVSTGRGSGASSYFNYLIGIININPMKYKNQILFERFLTPEKIAALILPDFDMDTEVQSQIFEFLRAKYGNNYVARICTYQFLKIKSALKDVFRVMRPDYSADLLNELTKSIDEADVDEVDEYTHKKLTPQQILQEAINKNEKLNIAFKENPDVKEQIDLILGTPKSHGVHAGGIIVSPVDLRYVAPLQFDSKIGFWKTDGDMHDAEKSGMIKFDMLGLSTLKTINACFKLVKKRHNKQYSIDLIPTDDQNVLDQFRLGHTESIFQFGTDLSRSILIQLNKIRGIEDLAIATSIARPGPMELGAISEFVQRANGLKAITFKFKEQEEILSETYGILVFQESIQLIAQRMAGFKKDISADLIKQISKKNKEKVEKYKKDFIDGCMARNPANKIEDVEELWSEIETFAEYAFNAAHALSYATLSYVCMYLKYYHPIEWKVAVLESAKKDKLELYLSYWGNDVVKPRVNVSLDSYTIMNDKNGNEKIFMPLSSINGVKNKSVDEIINKRPYVSFDDFINKINKKAVNKAVISKLILSGAFDEFCEETNHSKMLDFRKKLYVEYLQTIYKPVKLDKRTIKKISEDLKAEFLSKGESITEAKVKKLAKEVFDENQNKVVMSDEVLEAHQRSKSWFLMSELDLLNFTSFDYLEIYKAKAMGLADSMYGCSLTPLSRVKSELSETVIATVGGILEVNTAYTKTGKNKGNEYLIIEMFNGVDKVKVKVFNRQLVEDKRKRTTNTSKLDKLKRFMPVLLVGKVNEWNGNKDIIYQDIIILN